MWLEESKGNSLYLYVYNSERLTTIYGLSINYEQGPQHAKCFGFP